MIFRFCPGSQLPDEKREQFTQFLDNQSSAHPFQYPQWASLGSALRTRTYCCWLEDGIAVRAFARANVIHPASRFLPAHRALALNRGPVCDDPGLHETFLSRLIPAARELGFIYVDANPECVGPHGAEIQSCLERNGWTMTSSPRASLRLGLCPEPGQLFAGFRKTTRHEVRGAEDAGISATPAVERTDFEAFYDLLEGMAEEKHFAPESRAELRHVWQWISSERMRGVLLLARRGHDLHGGVVIVRAGRRAWYVWGATRKQLRYSVGHLLQWRAILWAKEAGCTEYDFGGYTVGATGGPACFKHGFCDHVVEFLPVYRLVLNDARYQNCESWVRWRSGSESTARAFRQIVVGGTR
jgi:Acetyltransferase (GNAT) domain